MSETVFKCDAGTFSGYETDACVHVRGIRYASSRRFSEPEPFRYEPGVHVCREPAPFAVQCNSKLESYLTGFEYDSFPQEETPQYLSLTLPKERREPLPVMVWFHGGGFRNGGCDNPIYNYEYLSNEQNVILVGVNYRLGIPGFTIDESGALGNNGLLDALESLRWIQRNIAAFGGDPDNVTIFGQSAGAELVRCVMLSQGSEDLYRRAILQSDPIGTMSGRSDMEKIVANAVKRLPKNCSTEDLRRAQEDIVHGIREPGNPKYMIYAPHFGTFPLPSIDEIPERLNETARSHALLIGCTTREISVYGGRNRYLFKLDRMWGIHSLVDYAVRRIGWGIFNGPVESFAEQYAEADGTVWQYEFYWEQNRSFIAAGHTLDLVPLFGADAVEGRELALGYTAEEIRRIGAPMRDLWGQFARTGILPETMQNDLLMIRRCDAYCGH